MESEAPEPSMQLLAEAAQTETRSLENGNAATSDQDDRSSSLSDLDEHQATEGTENNDRSSRESEEEDTEAETERLEESPQKVRKQKKVLLSANMSNGSTEAIEQMTDLGSKTATTDTASKVGQNDLDHDADAAPQTSDISSLGDSAEGSEPETRSSSPSKKRKRDNDDEDTKQSLKKVALELANHAADLKESAVQPNSPHQDAAIEDARPIGEEGEVSEDEGEQSSPEEHADEEHHETLETEQQDAADSNDEEGDMEDAGHEADAASFARSEEEMMRKKAAMDMLSKIEANFAILRDKLFADKNQQLSDELSTMQSHHITHPEYLAMVEAIEQQRKDRLKHARTLYNYKVQALRNRCVANRAQILSQYGQAARDLRDNAMDELGQEWYQIQRGRRRIDEEDNTALTHFSGSKADHIARHTAYNTEVSILSGIAKYVGFPAAPTIEGASSQEIEEDLKNMGISRQTVPVPIASTLNFTRQRPAAEEQFIEQTPWANPQHPIHRQLSNQIRAPSPFTTPSGQKRASEPQIGSASTIAAFPSSSLAPTPMSGVEAGGSSKVTKSVSKLSEALTETPSRRPVLQYHDTSKSNTKKRSHLSKTDTSAKKETAETSIKSGPARPTLVDAEASNATAQPNSPQATFQSLGNSPQLQRDRVEKQFTPQPSAHTSVEVGNS